MNYLKSFLLLSYFTCSTLSADILSIFHFPGRSHYLFASPLLVRLAERGHNVTVYTHYPKPKGQQTMANYTEVDISRCFHMEQDFGFEATIAMWGESLIKNLLKFPIIGALTVQDIEQCEPARQLLNSSRTYDLLIAESFMSDLGLLLANKFKVPFITTTPNVLSPWQAARVANAANPAYVPTLSIVHGFLSNMTFIQRVQNTVGYLGAILLYYTITMEKESDVTRHFLGPSAPSMYEMVKKTSLIFSNSDAGCLTPAFPMVPSVIQLGGMQIVAAQALPKDIEKFINESKHGVVYFCMGSLLRGETFPEAKRKAFLEAFSRIPQRVLWKWEGDMLPGKSDNIMISKWMPQRDILAHPNIKLFISHGGLLGTSEAVYEGVPILGIPIFGDQRTNLKSIEMNGAGEILDYTEISTEVVYEKITRLIRDPKYKNSAINLSIRYKDRPMSPLDTAVYWTEYVIRHKGAHHLKTAAVHMPWYQYLLLDVIAFLTFILISSFVIIYYSIKLTLRFIFNLICNSKSSDGKYKSEKKIKRS